MAGINFIKVAEYMFTNKNMYRTLSDEDKINNFFILNKKFSMAYPKVAQFLNRKGLDKASALDYWFLYFYKQNKVPGFFFNNSKTKAKVDKSSLSQEDVDIMYEYFDIQQEDANFLNEHFKDEIDNELNKIKRFRTSAKK